jgi:tetratricopeptide (TPR) repeat protein
MPRTAHAATAYDQGLKLSSAGRHLEAINQYEQALAQDPHDPRILFALGNTAGALGMRGPAEQFFRQVLAIDPARLEATVNLANLLRENGQFDAAIALLEPALARSPQSPELNLTLGSAWRESGDNSRAEPYYLAALDVRPDYAPALSNLADLRCDQGAWDEARALYDRAIRGDPKNPQIRLNRAIMNLLCGALKDGWRDYEARIGIPGKVPAANLNLAPWTGETLRGKRLLVRAEQGVGDQILFASTIPDLCARATHDGGSVVLECEPRLADLFARSFPGARVYPARISSAGADYTWLKSAGGVNAAVPMGSLPRYLRGAPERFPDQHAYLMPDALEAARWRQLMGGGAKTIGICWRSGKSGGHRSLQYAPLEEWGAFLRRLPAGVLLVSVQYDAAPEEIAALEQLAGRPIAVPGGIDQKNELDRAAALLSALDAVVSAPTAVAWLAAATGTATWKVLYDTSWTALGQSYEPFAPACKLAMPQTRGDWPSAFAEVIRALY